MKRLASNLLGLALIVLVLSCGKEPEPSLPSYLRLPAALNDYTGSGLITVTGGSLNLRAEGPEQLDASTRTYSGVGGTISGDNVTAHFTLGQPRPYRDLALVPDQYWAYGDLTVRRAFTPGTYPMGGQSTPTPRGEIADLTMYLPGPQLYVNNSGSLTITESRLIRTEGSASLYRVQGTFQALMYADGVGIPADQRNPTLTGSFDMLLVRQ